MKPTPKHVMDAISIVAEHLMGTGYGGVVIGPNGGASFSVQCPLEKIGNLLHSCDRFIQERNRAQRRIGKLRLFIEWASCFVGWSKPEGRKKKKERTT